MNDISAQVVLANGVASTPSSQVVLYNGQHSTATESIIQEDSESVDNDSDYDDDSGYLSGSTSSRDSGLTFGLGKEHNSASNSKNRLCDICKCLDIQLLFTEKLHRRVYFGKWEEVQQSRDCPLCRLVVACLEDLGLETDSTATDHVKIFLDNQKSWKRCITSFHYDGPESKAYSNKYDLRSRAISHDKDSPGRRAYRLLVLIKDRKNREHVGEIQYLANQEHQGDQQFFGRRVEQNRASLALIRGWFQSCQKFHDRSCEEPGEAAERLPWLRLRVIDVHTRKVIVAPPGCRYVALSYVWGQVNKFKAMEHNFKIGKDGLEYLSLPLDLPRTISDAIVVVRSLKETYLWVDQLCIMQDSHADKHHQMLGMDTIYSSAVLTIVAGSGADADVGLHGVSIPRKCKQQSETVQGFRLTVNFPSYARLELADKLVWNTRAWTFQEKLLSRRILLFTEYQVYFRCSNMVWCEDLVMETGRCSKSFFKRWRPLRWAADRGAVDGLTLDGLAGLASHVKERNVPKSIASARLLNYASAVREYTRRSLTRAEDAVYAISGVLETLHQIGPFYEGIPDYHLDAALLWKAPDGYGMKQRPKRDCKFPSWTWAAWELPNGCCWIVDDLKHTAQGMTKWIITVNGIRKVGTGQKPPKVAEPPMPPFRRSIFSRLEFLLYFRTSWLKLRIGHRLLPENRQRTHDQYHGIDKSMRVYDASWPYALIDQFERCIGEIWLTPSTKDIHGSGFLDFITLSWGYGWLKAVPSVTKHVVANVMLVRSKNDIAERVAVGKIMGKALDWNVNSNGWVLLG